MLGIILEGIFVYNFFNVLHVIFNVSNQTTNKNILCIINVSITDSNITNTSIIINIHFIK